MKARLVGYLGIEKDIDVDKIYPIIAFEIEEKWGVGIAHLDSPTFISSMDVLLTKPETTVYFVFDKFVIDNDYIIACYKQHKERDSDADARLD